MDAYHDDRRSPFGRKRVNRRLLQYLAARRNAQTIDSSAIRDQMEADDHDAQEGLAGPRRETPREAA